MTTSALDNLPVYDSAERRPPIIGELSNLRRYRGLLRLLVARELTLRYKRSLLGVWWTLLNPLLTTAVMWLVFSAIFRFETPGNIPFIVYLMSGILFITFFQHGINVVGQSVVSSASILTKVHVPPEIFPVAAALASAVNFLINLIPLILLQLVTGTGVPWTFPLVVVPVVAMLALIAGLGLLVATSAVQFADTLDLVAIIIGLASYLTPTFYPITIVPEGYRWFVYLNPLYSYLVIFRQFAYGGPAADPWMWAVMLGTAVGALGVGAWSFSRRWARLVAML